MAMNGCHFLLVIKFKLANFKHCCFGCYSPGRASRSIEDSYCWEDVVNYDK
jgi:hypothetical protein